MASLAVDEQSSTSPKMQTPSQDQERSTVSETKRQRAESKSVPENRERKKSQDGGKDVKSPQDSTKDSKPSGAELKKRAKEEKAARRAKEKQEKQPSIQPGAPKQTQQAQTASSTAPMNDQGAPKQGAKNHRRTGSMTANTQKQLPIRGSEPQAATVVPAPKKENKNVALFSHLYGQPRRTSMAGAGKDIHPAVVTLGLKMSHYIICGSNARCVAMLLAFIRVGIYLLTALTLAKIL